MTRNHDMVERELRAARSAYDAVPVSADAWQQNQRRLGRSKRIGSRLHGRGRVWLATAAVVAGLGVGGLALSGLGSVRLDGGPPAGREDDPFADKNLLGPIATVDTPHSNGSAVTYRVALSDRTGDGPQLCDEYIGESSATGGCAPRGEQADDPAVAIDWLSGTDGDGPIRRVAAGVDDRVVVVEVWLSDGRREVVDLHPGGWEGTQVLGVSRPVSEGVPQRIVAYGKDRDVLQAVDLRAVLGGDDWLPPHYACAGDGVGEVAPDGAGFPNVHVDLGTRDARISVRTSQKAGGDGCIELLDGTRAIAGVTTVKGVLVVVTAPEVSVVRATAGGRTIEIVPMLATGAPWAVAVVPATMADQSPMLKAYDSHGPLDEPIRP